MLDRDDGIVLGVARSGESSLLVNFLGRRTGKVRIVAKGALTPRHAARGLLEAGNHLEVLSYHRGNSAYHYLKEASLLDAPTFNRDSLAHMVSRLAAMELVDQVCVASAADEEIVDCAIEYLKSAGAEDPLYLFLAFELRLLDVLGLSPDVAGCSDCGKAVDAGQYDPREGRAMCAQHGVAAESRIGLSPSLVAAVLSCLNSPMSQLSGSPLDAPTRKDLGRLVHWTYTFHVQGYRLPKSLSLI